MEPPCVAVLFPAVRVTFPPVVFKFPTLIIPPFPKTLSSIFAVRSAGLLGSKPSISFLSVLISPIIIEPPSVLPLPTLTFISPPVVRRSPTSNLLLFPRSIILISPPLILDVPMNSSIVIKLGSVAVSLPTLRLIVPPAAAITGTTILLPTLRLIVPPAAAISSASI